MRFGPAARAPAAALLLLTGLGTRGLSAQPEASPPAQVALAPPAASGPLRVLVDARGLPFDSARLQKSLSRELGRQVTIVDSGTADVSIQLDSETHAEVHYHTPSGQTVRRYVELPPDRERSLLVLSWLVVNLVRDEAAELLDELRARRKAEADARVAAEQAAHKAAADKAAADEAAAEKAAAEKASAGSARRKAEADAQAKPRDPLIRDKLRSFDVALWTPLSLLRDSAKRELHLQLALVYGDSGAIRGVAASPGVLRIRQDLNGPAAAMAFLLVGGNARGAVVSAGYARVEGRVDGAAIGAGLATARSLEGVMVSGGVSLLREPSQAIMVSGGGNVAGDLTGIQVAGGINVARDFRGIALGPVNVQRRVRGIQLGVVNVAQEVDGVAIGIISLARNGRLQPVLWGSSDQSAHLALKSIAGHAFTQLGGGIGLNGQNLSYEGGIGAHLRISQSFFVEPGVHYSATHRTQDASGDPDRQYLYYLAQVGLRVGDKLDLLVGAGVRQHVAGGTAQPLASEVRAGIGFF